MRKSRTWDEGISLGEFKNKGSRKRKWYKPIPSPKSGKSKSHEFPDGIRSNHGLRIT